MEEHCRTIATELVRQGHRVHVLTTSHPDRRASETAYGATVHYLAGTPPGDYSRSWWRESRRWAQAHFSALGVETVLSMSFAASGLVGLGGPPIHTIVHGWGLNHLRSFWHDSRGWRRLIEFPRSARWFLSTLPRGRALLLGSRRILAVSREIEHELRGYGRVSFLPNCIDTAEFTRQPEGRARARSDLGVTDRDCLALMASTLTWQKGVHLGLRACAVVGREHPELAVAVVGGGPAAAALAEEVRRAAPQLRAHFLGPRPHAELPPFYAAADLFLLPTLRQEGMPTTILEAMAAGLAVVAMRAGGTPTGVADGETGLLVPLGDVRAFAAALRDLVVNPERRRAMGRAARARAVAEFDKAIVIRRLAEILAGDPC